MRTLVKLGLTALVLNAVWQLGSAYWTYYQFRDAVQDVAEFSADKSQTVVEGRVRELADRLEIPLAPEHVHVKKEQTHTYIDASYVQKIELLPRYPYPWQFNVSVDGWTGAWLER